VFTDAEAAPLLCAGAVGYRSLRLTGLTDGHSLGLTGFGASGHLVLKMVRHQYPKTHVYVFARSKEEQTFAHELGATWAGDTNDTAPELLDAVIDTTPVWSPIVTALGNLKPGGRLVINAIRKEETDKAALLGLDYAKHLWMEKEIKSVANVTRRDVAEFLELAARIPVKPEVQEYALEDANQALLELKQRRIRGAKVLRIN
jgi:propanol-preferring alcohol dehydrogenase